jgi:hypothetical protein
MLARGAIRGAMRRPAVRCARPAAMHVRNLNIHEYQSAALMEKMGVNVPFGIAVHTVEEAVAAAATIGDEEVVIKSQILAGGRGLGTFTNGLQGGVHIIKSSEVEEYASQMLGGTLVTKQTGPAGKPVGTLLLAKKMELVNEMYFAILLDRVRAPFVPPSPRGSGARPAAPRRCPPCEEPRRAVGPCSAYGFCGLTPRAIGGCSFVRRRPRARW